MKKKNFKLKIKNYKENRKHNNSPHKYYLFVSDLGRV